MQIGSSVSATQCLERDTCLSKKKIVVDDRGGGDGRLWSPDDQQRRLEKIVERKMKEREREKNH